MDSIEVRLKTLILSRYKSIREFSVDIDMPYSTLDSIFKRGIVNASVNNVIKICTALNISADLLAKGDLSQTFNTAMPAENIATLSTDEEQLLGDYRKLSTQGKEYIRQTMEMTLSLYKKDSAYANMEAAKEIS